MGIAATETTNKDTMQSHVMEHKSKSSHNFIDSCSLSMELPKLPLLLSSETNIIQVKKDSTNQKTVASRLMISTKLCDKLTFN